GGQLSGTGDTTILTGATMELRSGVLDGRPIRVAGTLRGIGTVDFRRSPLIEVQSGAAFTAADGFWLRTTNFESWNTGNGEIGQLNLFGRFPPDPGAVVRIGLQLNMEPGGSLDLGAGRLELRGGGSFLPGFTLPAETVLVLAGPGRADLPAPTYRFPPG